MTPSKTPPTIYDVAKAAGLSIATISRVLNSPDKVGEATRSRVLAVIKELGFVPKAEARSRALKNIGRVGVLTPFFTGPSFVQRLRGTATALNASNYELVVYTVDTAVRLENYLATFPLTRNVDGLIIMSLLLNDSQTRQLVDAGIEIVMIEYPQPDLCTIEIDDIHGGEMAANYLLQQGHRRLAFLGDSNAPQYTVHPITSRLAGFRKTLEEHNIPLSEENIKLAPIDYEEARILAYHWLQQPDHPTAIFVATDLQAAGVLRAARELGLRVPGDLAIIGFDDLDLAEYLRLTTIRQPLDESGRVAAELLLSRLADPERPVQHIQLPLSLVKRDTA